MINDSKKLAGPFLIDLKNRFREIAGSDQLIDITEFQSGLKISNDQVSNLPAALQDEHHKLLENVMQLNRISGRPLDQIVQPKKSKLANDLKYNFAGIQLAFFGPTKKKYVSSSIMMTRAEWQAFKQEYYRPYQ